jgi:hypothetical protein
MKPIKALLILVTLITAPIAPAFANSRVEILGANYGGNGCPAGSAGAAVSPDGQELNILFNDFIALGNTPGQSRKSCNISIPINVPQGFQVSIDSIDYQGYVAAETKGTLRAEHFFSGNRSPIFSRTFDGESNYNIKDAQTKKVWSKCGENANLRVNVSMLAEGAGKATVEKSPMFHLKYRSCRSVGTSTSTPEIRRG